MSCACYNNYGTGADVPTKVLTDGFFELHLRANVETTSDDEVCEW